MSTAGQGGDGHGDGHGLRNTERDETPKGGLPSSARPRRNQLHQLDAYRCALALYRRVGQIVELVTFEAR